MNQSIWVPVRHTAAKCKSERYLPCSLTQTFAPEGILKPATGVLIRCGFRHLNSDFTNNHVFVCVSAQDRSTVQQQQHHRYMIWLNWCIIFLYLGWIMRTEQIMFPLHSKSSRMGLQTLWGTKQLFLAMSTAAALLSSIFPIQSYRVT